MNTLHQDETATVSVAQGSWQWVCRHGPLDKIAFYGVGWQLHVEHSADYFAGSARQDEQARWQELEPSYLELAAALR